MLAYYEDFLDLDNTLWGFRGRNHSCELHFHERIELCFILSGEKIAEVGESKYTVSTGDIIFVPKYVPHGYCNAENCEDFVFCLPVHSTSELEDVLKKYSLPTIMRNKDFNTQKIAPLLTALFAYVESDKPLIVRSYVNIIVSLLFEAYESETKKKSPPSNAITDILNYIEQNFSQDITLESLARHFGYNKFYFSKIFNKHLNTNIKTYVNFVRTKHLLSRLISSPDLNISELIFDVGFSSTSTFYRFFAEHYKTTPKNFLQRL